MLKNYFLVAWRNLTRHRLNTTINILGLTLGLTTCLIVFLLVSHEMSYDKFHPAKDRIYRIVVKLASPQGHTSETPAMALPLVPALRNDLTGVESAVFLYMFPSKVTIQETGKPERTFAATKWGEEPNHIILAEPQYFSIFSYQWLAGNAATALTAPSSVVLTEKEAARYFGAGTPADWMGRSIVYRDSLPLTVSGIVKDWEGHTDLGFQDFVSSATIDHSFLGKDMNLRNWGMWDNWAQGYVKLAAGVQEGQLERQFPGFIQKYVKMPRGATATLSLQPLSDLHFNSKYKDGYSRQAHLPTLYALMGIAIFILLIASINFVNLSTAQSVRRSREVGVRKVLGGSRGSLVRQFLAETLLLVLAAVVLSLLITNPLIAAFRGFIPEGVWMNPTHPFTLLFILLTAVITCLLAGLYPAKVLSSWQPAQSLKGQGLLQLNSKSYLRKSLIVFQFTVSLVFIIGTIVVGRQIHFVMNEDLGFDKDAILTASIAFDRKHPEKRAALASEWQRIPGVQLTSLHAQSPAAAGHPGTFIDRLNASEGKADASFDQCDPNYIPLYGLKIIAGRNIFPSDTAREFILNEACARALGFRDPKEALGQVVTTGINHATGPVIGIVRDFHSASFHEAITPFFLTGAGMQANMVSVKLATTGQTADNLHEILTKMEKVWASVYPDKQFDYHFFDETLARLYEKEQKTAKILNVAMGIAIFISCMGLFGLAAYTAEQRTKEIGIRKVLGASVAGIVSMLSLDFIKLVGVSIVIASPLAWLASNKWLEDFVYRTSVAWWIFFLAGGCAMAIALLTVSWQAIRAARANPVKALRGE